MDNIEELIKYIKDENIIYAGRIPSDEIVIDEKVREYCKENKCGQYNKNFTCPPYVGEVEDFKDELKSFDNCIVVLKETKISNENDLEQYFEPARKLNRALISIENKAKELGFEKALALFAGNCKFCNPCKKVLGYEKCPHPELSRPSSESLGVDVMKTVNEMGVKIQFKEKEVTWVGMVLI